MSIEDKSSWERFKIRMTCFIKGHDWDKYRGYYEEEPTHDAVCMRCGQPYVVEYE